MKLTTLLVYLPTAISFVIPFPKPNFDVAPQRLARQLPTSNSAGAFYQLKTDLVARAKGRVQNKPAVGVLRPLQAPHLAIREDDPVYEVDAPPNTMWRDGSIPWTDWHRDVVVKAWRNALKLAEAAANSLDQLKPGSTEYESWKPDAEKACAHLKSGDLSAKGRLDFKNCYRTFIATRNPAYGQFFGADPDNIELIANNFRKVLMDAENIAAEGRSGQPLLLSLGPTIKLVDSDTNECDDPPGTEAMVVPAADVQGFKGAYPEGTQMIHFCPPFFDDKKARMETQLQILETDESKKAEICNLANLDSTARVLLHEITHLPWTLNTNPGNTPKDRRAWPDFKEIISYTVAVDTVAQKMSTKSFSSKNADSYAAMAVYNYFNNLDKCAGVKHKDAPSDCNTDVWPPEFGKAVKYQWTSYPKDNN